MQIIKMQSCGMSFLNSSIQTQYTNEYFIVGVSNERNKVLHNTFKLSLFSSQDTSGACEEKESQEGKEEEDGNLDFEEISDGELEEERTRGMYTEIF